jgi:hypothetical protein
MKRMLVRYKTKPESADENQRLIENVFAELRAKVPAGVHYAVLRLPDGSFIHFAETADGAPSLPSFAAFQEFQSGIRQRCSEPPQPAEPIVVGNYRMLPE